MTMDRHTLDTTILHWVQAGIPEPRQIADKIAAEVDAGDLADVATELLAAYVNTLLRKGRHHRPPPTTTTNGAPNSERWAVTAALSRDPHRWTVDVHGTRKFLGECTDREIDQIAAAYTSRAAAMTDRANRYRCLGELMRERGATEAAELPREDILAIFDAAEVTP